MTLQRSQREWNILINEYNICKKKLQSKRDALKILMTDLESCQRERDVYKNKIKQMQQELDSYKLKESTVSRQSSSTSSMLNERNVNTKNKRERERSHSSSSVWEQELQSIRDRKNKTLSQLLCEAKDENKAYQKDLNELRLLYKEAQEDILLLRDKLSRQKPMDKPTDNSQDFLVRQDLISQLEESQEQKSELERELHSLNDEKSEVTTERDHFRDKVERLNKQLNFILGADDRRLVDIDAVLMENRYLKEQIKQLKEEKGMASASLARYRAICEKRKNKILKAGYPNSYMNQAKQSLPSLFSELTNSLASGVSPSTVTELQFLVNSLSENLTEKDTALTHQRRANKILGNRVAELEKKLKTLEVSGLWSLEGHRGYGSSEAETMNKDRLLLGGWVASEKEQSKNNHQVEGNSEPAEQAGHESSPDSPAEDWHEDLGSPDVNCVTAFLQEPLDKDEVLISVDGDSEEDGHTSENETRQAGHSKPTQPSDDTEGTPDSTIMSGKPPSPSHCEESAANEQSDGEGRCNIESHRSISIEEEFLEFTNYLDTNMLQDGCISLPTSPVQTEGDLEPSLSEDDELEAADPGLAQLLRGVTSSEEV